MARRKAEEETPTAVGSQMWKHEDLVEYIEDETGEDLSKMEPAEVVGLAFKYRNQWRKTSRYEDLVESHREEADERRKERQKERRAEKAASAPAKKAPAKKKAPARKARAKRTKKTT